VEYSVQLKGRGGAKNVMELKRSRNVFQASPY